MFQQLLESRRARRFAGGALLASVAVHAATVGAASRGAARSGSAAGESILIRYLLPPDRPERPRGERVQFVEVGAGGWAAGTDPSAAVAPAAGAREPQPAAESSEPVEVGEPVPQTALYTEDQVDSAAVRDPNSDGPTYPGALLAQGVQGEVLVEFTVDTTGHADPASFEVVQASHPLFAEAVREALPRMLFSPAVAHGQRVRQLVRLPMKFRLVTQEAGTI